MLSRVARNVYWLTRYLERTENTARLINVHGNLLLDLPKRLRAVGWEPLIAITGGGGGFYEHYRAANETNVVKWLISDPENPSSILSSLKIARENLRTSRDLIPREAFEEANSLYLAVKKQLEDGVSRRARYELLKFIIRHLQMITGLLHGTMSHGTAYSFLRVGCYLERADMTSRILHVRSANLLTAGEAGVDLTPLDNIQWMSVLKSLTAYQMYRQHMRLQVTGADVLDFLLRDADFPRSVLYCLTRASYCIKAMPRKQGPLRRINRLQRQVRDADVHALADAGTDLHEFIDTLQIGFNEIHQSLNTTYFGAGKPPRTRRKAA